MDNPPHNILHQTFQELFKTRKESLHILAIGKGGVGKSALVNALLDEELFPTSYGSKAGSIEDIDHRIKVINGVLVHGYDTRGLFGGQASDDDVIAAISKCSDDFDIILVCMKFGDRFGDNEQRLLDLVLQLPIHNVWGKAIVALTHCDIIPPEWKRNPDEISKLFDKAFVQWNHDIHVHLNSRHISNDVFKIPIVPTSHVAESVVIAELAEKQWLEKLLYEIATLASSSPAVVLALGCAVNPMRFIAMTAGKMGHPTPQTIEDACDLVIAIIGKGCDAAEALSDLYQSIFDNDQSSPSTPGCNDQYEHILRSAIAVLAKRFNAVTEHKDKMVKGMTAAVGGAALGATMGAAIGSPTGVGIPVGAAIGGAVGGVVGTILFLVVSAFYTWKKKQQPSEPEMQTEPETEPQTEPEVELRDLAEAEPWVIIN